MDTRSVDIAIDGMSCSHCVAAVRDRLASLDGIESLEVTIGSARLALSPGATSEAAITDAIEDEGYTVVSVSVG